MAAPATPSNFIAQQGNGSALVSWDISSGATSYKVYRSTDNVTFALLTSPATPYYLDTSVTVGIQYFYTVSAYNGAESSQSSSVSCIPALTGTLSLMQIRQMAQQRADLVGSSFITVPEWNNFVNQSLFELYDLLVTSYEDYFLAAPYSFVTDGTNYQYALPPNFDKLMGVDVGLGGGNTGYVTIQKFDFIERNRYVYPSVTSTFAGVFNARYRVLGSNLHLIPTPSSGQTIRVWYVPRMTQLLKDTDIADGISGWLQYVIIRAAKYALDKEETDSSKLDAELLFLKQRIEESASNRDAGAPDTISRTRRSAQGGFGPNGDGDKGGF